MILVKKFKFLPKLNLFQNGSNMRSDGGPDKKEVFLDYKNVTLRLAKNLHFRRG